MDLDLRSLRGLQGEEGSLLAGPGPQGLLVQGAVEAVNLLLTVFLDVVHVGPTTYHL